MKKFNWIPYVCLTLVALGAWAWTFLPSDSSSPVTYNHPAIFQERTTHGIAFMGANTEEPLGICTATAIGPHALLTAEHCNEDSPVPSRRFYLDSSTHVYHILMHLDDDKDHTIYLIDGPAFKNYDYYTTRKPLLGERVFIVGCGRNNFPCDIKVGTVLNEFDPSEVNADQGIFYVSIPVVHGDSGALVYGEDGQLLGVITYLVSKHEGSGFELGFSQAEVNIAKGFNLGGLSGNFNSNTPDGPIGLGAVAH